MDSIAQQTSQKMQKVLGVLQEDLNTVRTGRAAPSLVDHLEIVVYGGSARMKIMEVATVAVSDAQTILITPFDKSILDEIQRGIMEANIGFTPSNDGTVIRISIPPLSQERRQELIHLTKQKLENGRIMLRQARHEAMEELKADDTLSEDDLRRLEKEVQKITDEYMEKIESIGKAKEEELMQI